MLRGGGGAAVQLRDVWDLSRKPVGWEGCRRRDTLDFVLGVCVGGNGVLGGDLPLVLLHIGGRRECGGWDCGLSDLPYTRTLGNIQL